MLRMSIVHLLEQYPLFESILSEFGLRDLFALSLVSKRMRCVVKRKLHRAQQVDCGLVEFFDDPVEFRERLREERTWLELSGLLVLRF